MDGHPGVGSCPRDPRREGGRQGGGSRGPCLYHLAPFPNNYSLLSATCVGARGGVSIHEMTSPSPRTLTQRFPILNLTEISSPEYSFCVE